jgi:hypothetical protein
MKPATCAQSAAPSYAIKVWMDDNNVYAEIPSLNQPCVVRFPIQEGGLAKCLALLGAKRTAEAHGEPYIHRPAMNKKLMAAGVTVKDMDQAAEMLRRKGMLK